MTLTIPEYALVLLIGATGSGKSSFARRHFHPTEILSLQDFRGMVTDQSESEESHGDALEALAFVLEKRLKNTCLTVVDAPNVRQQDRKHFRLLAKKYHARLIAIVLDLPQEVCAARNEADPTREVPRATLRSQIEELKKNLGRLESEGIRQVIHLRSEQEVAGLEIRRRPVYGDHRDENGPFDIIGDVHGCRTELELLLHKLGYRIREAGAGSGLYYQVEAPKGRKAVFVGDLVDRGPDAPGVLKLVMSMVRSGVAHCVPGNHDDKLLRKLEGRNVKLKHGLAETMAQLETESPDFLEEVKEFIRRLPAHLRLDGGLLVVAHAGLREDMQGRESGGVRSFCLYGETTGETDEFGLPIRHNWAENYRGQATVVYGHTPIPHPEWLNRTLNIDTGCCFGGKLTALRYPEKELVEVPAQKEYCPPTRPLPLNVPEVSTQHQHDEILDFSYFRDRSLIVTRMMYNLSPRDWQIVAAVEHTNRFTVDPRWLIYLPFSASPPKTSSLPGLLEHPLQAFEYYRHKGLSNLMLQEMTWGNRAVVIVARDEQVVQNRFGLKNEGIGVVYDRFGRPLFPEEEVEQRALHRLRELIGQAGIWELLKTDWLCLEADLLSWPAGAGALFGGHHAALGSTAADALDRAGKALDRAMARGIEVDGAARKIAARSRQVALYNQTRHSAMDTLPARGEMAWAPVHLLAAEGRVYMDHPHSWHMDMARLLGDADPDLIRPLRYRELDLDDLEAVQAATRWWEQLTGATAPGLVVKPAEFVPDPNREIHQPAIHVRGKDALRLLYGPEYDTPARLESFRKRDLKLKREMTIRELASGYEALHRFVEQAPLSEVHQCIFAHLTIQTGATDSRL